MGCGSSFPSDSDGTTVRSQQKRHAEIEKQIGLDRLKTDIKLLLLGTRARRVHAPHKLPQFAGTGECGKSTILKQMK